MKSAYFFHEEFPDPRMTGNKANSLARLSKQFNVPEGFVIPADIIKNNITKYAHISAQFSNNINELLNSLNSEYYAVRSSAICEDSEKFSFAGQYSTYCGVKKNDIIEKIILVVNSAQLNKNSTYKKLSGTNNNDIAVIVQAMIPCEISGVTFTADPVKKDNSRVLIEACYGLCEQVVSGLINTDSVIYDKISKDVKKRKGTQTHALIFENGETKTIPVKNLFCLSDDKIHQVIELSLKIEELYSSPQDIEWGFYKSNLYILQSRNITTLLK